MKQPAAAELGARRFAFRLYVASTAPHSTRALDNLHALCRRLIGSSYDVDVVDVFREPGRALEEGILVTPTLVKLSPGPVQTIVGDLSDEGTVIRALGLSKPGGKK